MTVEARVKATTWTMQVFTEGSWTTVEESTQFSTIWRPYVDQAGVCRLLRNGHPISTPDKLF